MTHTINLYSYKKALNNFSLTGKTVHSLIIPDDYDQLLLLWHPLKRFLVSSEPETYSDVCITSPWRIL